MLDWSMLWPNAVSFLHTSPAWTIQLGRCHTVKRLSRATAPTRATQQIFFSPIVLFLLHVRDARHPVLHLFKLKVNCAATLLVYRVLVVLFINTIIMIRANHVRIIWKTTHMRLDAFDITCERLHPSPQDVDLTTMMKVTWEWKWSKRLQRLKDLSTLSL